MKDTSLIPELADWNYGKGIAPDSWIFIEGRADHALGFCAMLWPDLVEFEGYVLRAPLDVERLRSWERSGDLTKQQIETAMNAWLFDGIFPQDAADAALKDRQCERIAAVMVDMLSAKLAQCFPTRNFSAFVLDEDDYGITFHQV